ncbi:MAG: glycine--tRNA ligase subunit beta [Lactobacillales bacterium]|jgi:glycyl-tRNA synthetase beta chain|nr:glycine--tRNA ligase subunit beta [Lactobacillales bacterium]
MAKDLLLEIGLEEMPAHVVAPSMKQLQEKMGKFLTENRLSFEKIEAFSTPRRLAVRVTGIADKQEDTEEEIKGPAKKIALDADGNWSKAAQGFVRGKGLSTDDITFKEVKGVEYVYVTKFEAGLPAEAVLKDLASVVTGLTFPVSMHWADYDFEYIRPIHWIVALLDEEVIPFSVLDVSTGRTSRGHRLVEGTPEFATPSEYEDELAEYNVFADAEKRKQLIVNQINDLVEDNNWKIDIDENLLEEVNNLVEYPTAFAGSFAEKYLEIPEEVLVTSMKEHQRFFEVREEDGGLSPHFISVRNGDSEYIENVVKGNEKVLVARLEDGEFFWNEDRKLKISDLVEKLNHVTFHEKIGTLAKHMERTKAIAMILADKIGLSDTEKADLARASEIYKFDLVTNMVGEFPELQGIMGEKYATLQGETKAVGQAIREHYMPISADGELPESTVGAVLAVADKLESMYSFFSVDLIPSGSNDPYALRRGAQGVIRIIEDKNWTFPFSELQEKIYTTINTDAEEYAIEYNHERETLEFIKGRVRQLLSGKINRHDLLDAVVDSTQTDISKLFDAAEVLQKHSEDENFREVVEALTRVVNLAKKAEFAVDVNPALFENEEEVALHTAIEQLDKAFATNTVEENYEALSELQQVITAYFDHTMVMSEDVNVKNNRLSELKRLSTYITSVAAVDELIVK